MMLFLISIEKPNGPRLLKMSQYKCFEKIENFKKVGVIGKALTIQEYFELGVAKKSRPLSPSELGCSLSHIKAYQLFLESSEKYALIFEDDAIPCFDKTIEQIKEELISLNLPESVYFSLGGIQLPYSNNVRGGYIENKIMGMNIMKIHPLFIEDLTAAYAYMIDRKMAENLLEFHRNIKLCDNWKELDLMSFEKNFYATFIFDHPDLTNTLDNSYLQSERINIINFSYKKYNLFFRLKKKILRKLLKKYSY